ncbi:MAG: hypothetical protein Q9220_005371 [cf. Caloplaca sp. 1 TL-2023]
MQNANVSRRRTAFKEDESTPNSKRQRTTRNTTLGSSINYDMKYHPMDDVIRPHASAARKAAHGLYDDDPIKLKEADEVDGVDPVRTMLPALRPISRPSGSPSCRRVTRGETFGEKPALYNMKYHPMDAIMRPAHAKKIAMKSFVVEDDMSHSKPAQTPTSPKRDPGNGRNVRCVPSLPSISASNRPLILETTRKDITTAKDTPTAKDMATTEDMTEAVGWTRLDHSDRVIYRIQKGAHPDGHTLPMNWPEALQVLRSAPWLFDTFEKVIQNPETLRERYTAIYQALHTQHDTRVEPSSREDWTLRYAEDFDVYDYEVGDKYFSHRSQSIVLPATSEPVKDTIYSSPTQVSNGILPNISAGLSNNIMGSQSRDDTASNSSSEKDSQHGEVIKPEVPYVHNGEQDITNGLVIYESDGDSDVEDHDLNDSLNDAAAYVRQSMGRPENSSSHEDSEAEIIASMRNSTAANIEMIDLHELTPMFASSSGSANDKATNDKAEKQDGSSDRQLVTRIRKKAIQTAKETIANIEVVQRLSDGEDDHKSTKVDDETEEEEIQSPQGLTSHKHHDDDTESEEVEVRRPFRRRVNNRFTTRSTFSLHEDEPGNTPRIKRMVARNPMSPGTDIPKENLRERSPSEQ